MHTELFPASLDVGSRRLLISSDYSYVPVFFGRTKNIYYLDWFRVSSFNIKLSYRHVEGIAIRTPFGVHNYC